MPTLIGFRQVGALLMLVATMADRPAVAVEAVTGELAPSRLEEKLRALQEERDRLAEQLDSEVQKATSLGAENDRLRAAMVRDQHILHEQTREFQHLDTVTQRLATVRADLEQKVEELAEYRSEFFGRMRHSLEGRDDIRVVGDRFVLPVEILFASGSAELEVAGHDRLHEIAKDLKALARQMPQDLPWVLRVEGHTDGTQLLVGAPYHSNWELAAARAVKVVEYLVKEGFPANRLSAAGYGEFQPLVAGKDAEAYRRNRRIELKLAAR